METNTITLTTDNRPAVIEFLRDTSDWIGPHVPDNPDDSRVIVELINGTTHVHVGQTIRRHARGFEILNPNGERADAVEIDDHLSANLTYTDTWVRAYHLRTLGELNRRGLEVDGEVNVPSQFPHPFLASIEFKVREVRDGTTAIERFSWNERGGWMWTACNVHNCPCGPVEHDPHHHASEWVAMDLPVDATPVMFAEVAVALVREHPARVLEGAK